MFSFKASFFDEDNDNPLFTPLGYSDCIKTVQHALEALELFFWKLVVFWYIALT